MEMIGLTTILAFGGVEIREQAVNGLGGVFCCSRLNRSMPG